MLYAKYLEMVIILVNKQNPDHSEKRMIWMKRNEKN